MFIIVQSNLNITYILKPNRDVCKCLSIVLLLCHSFWGVAQKYVFDRVKPLVNCTNVVQDEKGYMWIASEQGLHWYNGNEIHDITEDDAFPEEYLVRKLLTDQQKNVWVGMKDNGLAIIQSDTTLFFNKENGLTHNFVFDLYKDQQQRMWVLTPTHVSLWTGTAFKHFAMKGFKLFWEDAQGRLLLLQRRSQKIFQYTSQQFQPYQSVLNDSLQTRQIVHALLDKQGNNWFLESHESLVKYDGKTFQRIPLPHQGKTRFSGNIFQDSENNIWVGISNGVVKYDGQKLHIMRAKNGLKGPVKSIYEDREKVLWITTLDGVYKYYGDHHMVWRQNQEIDYRLVYAFTESLDGGVWVGTDEGGIYSIKSTEVTRVQKFKPKVIFCFFKDSKKRIWIGTPKGLVCYDGKQYKTFTTKDGLESNYIRVIREDSKGNIWIGSPHGLNYYDGSKWRSIATIKKKNVGDILIDQHQQIWLAIGNEGVWKQEGSEWRKFNEENGLLASAIIKLVEDHQGNIWMASYRRGLILYDHQTFRTFTQKDGLPMNSVYGMLVDKKHQELWLHSRGVSRLQLSDFYDTGQFKLKTIGSAEGTLGAFYMDSQRTLWFGDEDGVHKYDLTKERVPKVPPIVQLESVRLFWEAIPWTKYTDSVYQGIPYKLELPYHQNHLTFSFVGITSIDPDKVRYKYQLEGNDKSWSPITSKHEVTYSNLPPGDYTLRVKALNNRGIWSQPLAYQFEINPAIWQTPWFYVLTVLGLLWLVFSVIKWRTHHLKKQTEKLEDKIQQRTLEITEKNERLLQKNEEIQTQTEEIKAQAEELKRINERLIELDDFKQGVTGMIVHDLKNPLNTLISHAQSTEAKQSAQQMLHMVLNILDVQTLEAAELKLHWNTISFSSLLNEALEQVKFLRQQKNLRIRAVITVDYKVRADQDLTLRVLVNLLSNAIKHSPLNAAVDIEVEEVTTQKIKVLITDEGKGVPARLQQKIFDKFFSIEARKQGLIKSTGLGLTFCKLAIEAQEGEIGVNNDSAKGACFWFTLHCIEKASSQEALLPGTETFVLDRQDKVALQPYLSALAILEVYEMSKVKKIVEQIDVPHRANIQQWKTFMLEATFSTNQTWYNELITLAKD